MKCHNYQAQRVELVHAVSQHISVTLQTLLFGNNSLPMNISIEIFEAVQTYILKQHLSHRSVKTKSRKDVTRFQIRAPRLLIHDHFFLVFNFHRNI